MPKTTDNSPLGDYLTKEELARELGRSTRTIDRWHTRRLGPRRTKLAGKLVLFKKSAVAEWLAANAEEQACDDHRWRQQHGGEDDSLSLYCAAGDRARVGTRGENWKLRNGIAETARSIQNMRI